MSQLMQPSSAPVASETGFLNRRWRAIVFYLEKRSLERTLETVLRAAAGHESNSMPAGAHEYQLLCTEADALCSKFASRWNLDIANLKARIAPGVLRVPVREQAKIQSQLDKPRKRCATIHILPC